jgi:protein-tyrosine phosphatase
VVRVEGNLLRILRPGVLTDSAVLRGGSLVVLLACTGNTCRSPMAQLILQKSIADRLQCDPKDLPARGVLVLSAGVAAAAGYPASPEAVRVMARRGLDLSQHESRPLTGVLVRFADLILTMTRSHHTTIVSQWPEAAAKTFLVGRDQADIPDPIGGTEEMYDRCAAHLETQLPGWVERLDLQTLPRLLLPENDKT